MAQLLTVSHFTDKLLDIMDRIEYRRIVSAEDMEEVSWLRCKAYRKAEMETPLTDGLFVDKVDFDPNAYVFGIYYEERLISSIRIHHVTPSHRVSPSRALFPEAVDSLLDAGLTLIDPARHASDPDFFDDLPALPYLTLRVATMASEYFSVDRCLSFIPPRHVPFYRRIFGSKQIAEPVRNCPGYGIDFTLMAADVPVELPKVYERYPFFRSQPFEQRMMFMQLADFATAPLTVLPTARYLAAA